MRCDIETLTQHLCEVRVVYLSVMDVLDLTSEKRRGEYKNEQRTHFKTRRPHRTV